MFSMVATSHAFSPAFQFEIRPHREVEIFLKSSHDPSPRDIIGSTIPTGTNPAPL